MSVRVKLCGITQLNDALSASFLGADAIGLVFYPKSKRLIELDVAKRICLSVPPFINRVGLFVNQDEATIRNVLDHVSLDILQFHGEESADFCQQFNKPYIKVFRVKTRDDLIKIDNYGSASAWLFDSYHDQVYGGSGEVFNWSLIPKGAKRPIILAGGLTSKNVTDAIAQVKPYAVDVSSGIECSPGIKDPVKMQAFMQAVRQTDDN